MKTKGGDVNTAPAETVPLAAVIVKPLKTVPSSSALSNVLGRSSAPSLKSLTSVGSKAAATTASKSLSLSQSLSSMAANMSSAPTLKTLTSTGSKRLSGVNTNWARDSTANTAKSPVVAGSKPATNTSRSVDPQSLTNDRTSEESVTGAVSVSLVSQGGKRGRKRGATISYPERNNNSSSSSSSSSKSIPATQSNARKTKVPRTDSSVVLV